MGIIFWIGLVRIAFIFKGGGCLNDFIIFLIFLEAIIYSYFYTSMWFHVIILMIFLEIIMLKNFLFRVFLRSVDGTRRYFLYVFIVLRVAEARIRISVLVRLIRSHGVDHLSVS